MPALTAAQVLRLALVADAVASGATGLLMAVGASFLAGRLGLPQQLLFVAGLILLPFAAYVGWLANSSRPSGTGVWAVIAINFVWVAASIFALVGAGLVPTALGYAFVIFQAFVVFALGEIQLFSLRRATAQARA